MEHGKDNYLDLLCFDIMPDFPQSPNNMLEFKPVMMNFPILRVSPEFFHKLLTYVNIWFHISTRNNEKPTKNNKHTYNIQTDQALHKNQCENMQLYIEMDMK